jgi:hypothetical protein
MGDEGFATCMAACGNEGRKKTRSLPAPIAYVYITIIRIYVHIPGFRSSQPKKVRTRTVPYRRPRAGVRYRTESLDGYIDMLRRRLGELW